MSDNEAWYDAEIAPALLAIGARLQERGLSMVAVVEYDPRERGTTAVLQPDAGLAMQMLRRCAHFGENIDGYTISVKRYCRENKVATDASIVLTRMAP
jgi:hypothetical protein